MAADSGSSPGKASDTAKERPGEKELESQEYFHGFRPRNDVVPLLTEIGDFLLRTSNKGTRLFIVLSVKVEHVEKRKKKASKEELKGKSDEAKADGGAAEAGTQMEKKDAGKKKHGRDAKNDNDELGCSHLRIRFVDGRWSLYIAKSGQPPSFPSIFELIEYYKHNPIMGKLRLGRPISKPTWHIKHTTVSFNKEDILGSGNFCDVYKGIYQKSEKEKFIVAIKAWHEKNKADEEGNKAPEDKEKEAMDSKAARESMISEALLLSYYKHRHVVHLYGVCCDHLPVLIVMEYCAGGNLEHHLKKQGQKITTAERLLYCLEAAKGMRYLHSKSCIHRDLAARNCLISRDGYIKITDFGLSQMMKQDQLKPTEGPKKSSTTEMKAQVPIRWMAPESLRKEDRTYSTKSDVWSYGILCYEIFNNGEKPWPEEDGWDGDQRRIHMKKIATWIRNCKMMPMPSTTPSTLKDFVEKKIWAKEPVDRPDMAAVCQIVHSLSSETPLPPDPELTINALVDVKRVSDNLDDTLEALPDEVDDQSTVFAKDQGTDRKKGIQTLSKDAPSKDAPTKETSDAPTADAPTKDAPTNQEASGREKKKSKPSSVQPATPKKSPHEKKKSMRSKNKKVPVEDKSSRKSERHKKSKTKPKSRSGRRRRTKNTDG